MAAHSALVPRRLNGGSIAGAVVGSVVGFLLILLCIVPFVLRARRRRRFARDGAADDQAEMGHSPSDGGRSSPPHVDDSNESKVDKPGHPTGHYPTPDSSTTGNGHDVNNKAHSDHSTQHSPTQPGLSLDNGLPLPLASPPAHPLPQPIAQAPSASPADQPTPPPTEVPSRDHSSLPSNVSKQGTRDLSVTDSYGPPSRELTGITTAGLTQEPESFEHPSHPTAHRRFSHISGSIRSLLHRRRDSQQRQQSKHSTLGGTDGARSPSVCTTEAFGQPDLPQPVLEEPFGQPSLPEPAFEADTTAQGLAWSYYNDPNLIPYSSTPAPANLFPPVPETTQAPLSPISLPDQQPLGSGVGVPPFMIGQNVVEEPYDIFPDAVTAAATPRPYAPRTSLLRGPGGTLTRTDSLPPLQPIYSDIGGPSFEAPLQPSGVPMYIFGPPTNEAESAHHLQHEMSRMSNSPRAPEHIEFPEPSEEVKAFLNNPIQNPMDLSSSHNGINSAPFNGPLTQGDMTLDGPLIQDDLDFNAPFIKNDPGSAHMTPYNSPPNLSVNGQDFSEVNYNTNLMGGQPLDPQVMANYPSYYTPPPSTGPSVQNTPETRLSEYTSSPSPRYDMSQSPLPPVDPPSVKYKCNQCDRSFEQIHKLNHHKRYHDRPHECTHPGCSMKFGTKTHLDRHVNDKHNKTRKFHCTQADCPYSKQGGKSFPRKDNWRRHMVNKHTITPDHDPIECNDETMLGT